MRTDGYCMIGPEACVCGGDTAAVQAQCDNWKMIEPKPARREWLIWSNYHNAWHRCSGDGSACGYTNDIAEAGLFEEAYARQYHGDGRGRDEMVVAAREKAPEVRKALLDATDRIAALGAIARAAGLWRD